MWMVPKMKSLMMKRVDWIFLQKIWCWYNFVYCTTNVWFNLYPCLFPQSFLGLPTLHPIYVYSLLCFMPFQYLLHCFFNIFIFSILKKMMSMFQPWGWKVGFGKLCWLLLASCWTILSHWKIYRWHLKYFQKEIHMKGKYSSSQGRKNQWGALFLNLAQLKK